MKWVSEIGNMGIFGGKQVFESDENEFCFGYVELEVLIGHPRGMIQCKIECVWN